MIKSERIKLVKPSLELVPEMQNAVLESQVELEQYLVWVQSSLNDPENNMQSAIDNHKHFKNELRYFLMENNSSTILGTIGLIIRDATVPFFEIGYWTRSSHTGHGYATEAVGLIEKYAFKELGANRLEIRMADSNLKSRAIAERCGYQFEAHLKQERRLPAGGLSDTLVYVKFEL